VAKSNSFKSEHIWGVIGILFVFLFGSFAFSGKLSMSAARVCLLLASLCCVIVILMITSVISSKSLRCIVFLLLLSFIGISTYNLYFWLQPEMRKGKVEEKTLGEASQRELPRISYEAKVLKPRESSSKEKEKKEENEQQRPALSPPNFDLTEHGINATDRSGHYGITITVTNNGDIKAYDFEGKLMIVDQQFQQCEPSIILLSSANEIRSKMPLKYSNTISEIRSNVPMYVIYVIKYYDALSHNDKKPYSQTWFLKWNGIQNGSLAKTLSYASIAERTEILNHLKSELYEFVK
jgi:hypothetical protein